MVTDSPPSPTAPAVVAANGGVDSPHSRRRNLPSAWASVVRGDSESSPTAAATVAVTVAHGSSSSPPPEQATVSDNSAIETLGSEVQPDSSDINGGGNADRPRRPAWNRPVNGVVEAGPVMGGAVSWPALSESTRPVQRSSSENFRSVSDGSASPSQAPIISQPPQRQANNSAHANSSASNTSTRPRSRNRGGGGGGGGGGGNSSGRGPSQNTFSRPAQPAPPPFPVFEVPYGMVPPMLDGPVRGARPVGGPGASQSHTDNDHSSHRNTSRRGGYGPRPRGDGLYQNNQGGRRDQDQRDVHLSPQFAPPPLGYMPSSPLPPGAAPFMSPPPVRIFPGQMEFDMASPFIYVPTMPPESFRAMPIPPPPPPMLFPPATENPLTMMIVKQIDYYFSDDNLVKDNFLKSNMDGHGWVPVTLIASFRRVQLLTKDIPVILDSLRFSNIVEVQGDKVRRRNDWQRWLHSSSRQNSDSGSHEAGSAYETVLANSLQETSLYDSAPSSNGNVDSKEVKSEIAAGRFLPESSTSQSTFANGEDTKEEDRS